MRDLSSIFGRMLDLLGTVLVPILVIGSFAALGLLLFGLLGAMIGGVIGAVMTASTDRTTDDTEATFKCSKCGTAIDPMDDYCPRCGAELDHPDPDEHTTVRTTDGVRYCRKCGHAGIDAEATVCPNCDRTIR